MTSSNLKTTLKLRYGKEGGILLGRGKTKREKTPPRGENHDITSKTTHTVGRELAQQLSRGGVKSIISKLGVRVRAAGARKT